jgi:hypothetical protein
MDNQNIGQEVKKPFWRAGVKYILVIVGALIIYVLIVNIYYYFRLRAGARMAEMAWQMERDQQEAYQRALGDNYGGKTPKETLQMYIDAVESGDYELASKYFVESKQEEWRQRLKNLSETKTTNNMLNPVREGLNSFGEFSTDKKQFFINNPIAIDFILYPSGVWKITEI